MKKKKWQPKKLWWKVWRIVSLRNSLTESRNLATLNLVSDLGVSTVTNELRNYGFKDVEDNLSITLGSLGVSLMDFSEAYSMFSNNGVQVKPYIIEQVINKNGQSVTFQSHTKPVMKPEQIYLMTSILQDVVTKGTGKSAQVPGIEVAGKTGTTNDNIDAWFCGYSPSIQTIIWFGKDNNTPMRKLKLVVKLQHLYFHTL